MTTPGGVPNLPMGALTLETLAAKLQDMSGDAMKSRAVERFPSIMDNSTGLSAASDITPFGILTRIWAEVNSLVATADPADIQGPEDLPELLLEFIEGLPVIGQFIELFQAILGDYTGDDETLLGIQALFAPIRALVDIFPGLLDGSLDPQGVWNGIINTFITPSGLIATVATIVNAVFKAITGFDRDGTADPLDDLDDALSHIPSSNVLGIGGPADIGSAVKAGWDKLVGGLVGVDGTGAGLADIFNVGNQVSSNAALGGMGWDILGIRNNKPLKSGFLPSGQANIGLDKVTLTAASVGITQSTALTAYDIIAEAVDIGAIAWQGSGVTSVTDCYVNIYKMDPLTGNNGGALHASANLIGLLSGSMQHNVYSLPGAPVHFEPGDILGAEIAIRGAGTHTVLGATSTLVDQAVFPRRWSSVRNSGTSAPPSTSWTPTYSNNVPVIEHAVSAGPVAIPHGADFKSFATPGTTTYPIPDWCNFVDRIVLGSAGGGHIGGTWGVGGEGGDNAAWTSDTLARGTDFTSGDSLTNIVPDGGNGSASNGGVNGADGGTATSKIGSLHVLSSTGGVGANSFDVLGSEHSGESPGNYTFPGGGPAWTVVGGAQQDTYGANGNPPGSGGAGGNWVSFQSGGKGAPGTILYRFRQS